MTTIHQLWPVSPQQWMLIYSVVHVWSAVLDQPDEVVQQLARTLADDEQARAARFPDAGKRKHFIVARVILRELLSRYVGGAPANVQFAYGPHGKPALAAPNSTGLQFNLAHSHGLAVYAFASGRRVGIDVERIRMHAKMEQLARRFFSSPEHAAWCTYPAGERHAAFFACWTRKEAYIKATGDGLAQPLHEFNVGVTPTDGQHPISIVNSAHTDASWSLHALTPVTGYTAALVAEGEPHIRAMAWKDASYSLGHE